MAQRARARREPRALGGARALPRHRRRRLLRPRPAPRGRHAHGRRGARRHRPRDGGRGLAGAVGAAPAVPHRLRLDLAGADGRDGHRRRLLAHRPRPPRGPGRGVRRHGRRRRGGRDRRSPSASAGQFDLVYASIGVLCWIADLDAWMARRRRARLRAGRDARARRAAPARARWSSPSTRSSSTSPTPSTGRTSTRGPAPTRTATPTSTWTTVQYAPRHRRGRDRRAAGGARLRPTSRSTRPARSTRASSTEPEDDGRYRLRLGVGAEHDGRREPACPMPVLFTLVARSGARPRRARRAEPRGGAPASATGDRGEAGRRGARRVRVQAAQERDDVAA